MWVFIYLLVYFIAPAGLKLTMETRLASNSQKPTFFGFLSAGWQATMLSPCSVF